jgi:hypothetical protein
MRSVLDKKKIVERIKTHILCSVTFPENRAVYEIMSKNMVEPEGPQMTSQFGTFAFMLDNQDYTRAHACTLPLTRPPTRARAHTHTHRQICNTYFFSTAIVMRTRFSVNQC